MESTKYGFGNENAGNITSIVSNNDDDSSSFTENSGSQATPKEDSCHYTKQRKSFNCKTWLSRMSCSPLLGLISIFISSLISMLASVILKKLTYISAGQLTVVTSASSLAGCIPIAVFLRKHLSGPKEYRFILIVRALLVAIAMYLFHLAYNLLPLAEATIILCTMPAVVMILAKIYLKERCGIVEICALIFTILGVLLSVRVPELIKDREFHFTIDYITGVASAMACVFCGAVALVCTRKLKGVHYSVFQVQSGLVGVVVNGGLTGTFSFYKLPSCGWDPILMMFHGVFRCIAMILIVLALQSESAGHVAIVRYCLDIAVAFFFQVLFFGEPPDAYNYCGAVIVSTAVCVIGVNRWLLQLPEDSKARKKMEFLLR